MNVNSTASMQQTQLRKMDGTGNCQGNCQGNGMGGMMQDTLSLLPQETQAEIKSLMQELEPTQKQDTMREMTQIETSNMTVEDLTAAIMDLFQPTESTEESSFPSSFSTYA